ncbi:MAG: arylsulfatase [Clostridiales bacterium]|nr:arylsulfatase [Clostridiales bacterium]
MSKNRPNVILVYADDLGYGDLSCYGGVGVETPNVDRLLKNGIRFTDGYSTSAVCTPARYSLLTGEYPFRNPKTHILPGDAACIIDKDKLTLPKVFKNAGYNTAVIGKWHLGLGDGSIDWNEKITHTPNDVGFDYSFIFPATNDRVPCVYIKDREVVGLDPDDPIEVSYEAENPYDDIVTATKNPELLRMKHSHGHDQSIVNGVGRIGYMRGGKKATWRDEDLAETFLDEVKGYITESGQDPFFIFYALHQPHVPRVPNERFAGKSKLGPRGDVILELDWCVGELLDHLEAEGVLEDTIIIFSSDNGPVLDDGYMDDAERLNKMSVHKPAGALRGGKYSKFDGGTRVPFIVSWASHIKPQTSSALISQVDILASFASMLDVDLEDFAPDSMDMIDTLLGESHRNRKEILAEALNKSHFLRQGKWTYLQPSEGPAIKPYTDTETGSSLDPQLYNMEYDIGQRENVAQFHMDIVKEMDARIEEIKASERTRK